MSLLKREGGGGYCSRLHSSNKARANKQPPTYWLATFEVKASRNASLPARLLLEASSCPRLGFGNRMEFALIQHGSSSYMYIQDQDIHPAKQNPSLRFCSHLSHFLASRTWPNQPDKRLLHRSKRTLPTCKTFAVYGLWPIPTQFLQPPETAGTQADLCSLIHLGLSSLQLLSTAWPITIFNCCNLWKPKSLCLTVQELPGTQWFKGQCPGRSFSTL